jgi:hypothetical protein
MVVISWVNHDPILHDQMTVYSGEIFHWVPFHFFSSRSPGNDTCEQPIAIIAPEALYFCPDCIALQLPVVQD